MMTPQITAKLTDLIGNTPLVDVSSMLDEPASLYAKCEFMTPGLSMKDRMVQYVLDKAEHENQIKPGDTIICASSGNTGLSIAMLGVIKGYKVIIVTSEKCSAEKQEHIRAFGAELIITKEEDYMSHARELAKAHGYFDIDQYNNPNNPEAYYATLGPEIWQQSGGQIDYLVMSSSTFGCITGTASYLKEQNSNIQVVLADPLYSNIADYYRRYKNQPTKDLPPKKYCIEGVGKPKPTHCADFSIIDDVIDVSDEEAIACCHQLAQTQGFFAGGSSGLNLSACQKLSKKINQGNIVTIFCDHGVKYLSKIYNPDFKHEQCGSSE